MRRAWLSRVPQRPRNARPRVIAALSLTLAVSCCGGSALLLATSAAPVMPLGQGQAQARAQGQVPAVRAGQPFRERFEAIKKDASPEELYRLLYELPKGGDIHHHLGLSFLAEDLWEGATNPAINKGNEFFTRIRVSACPSDSTPPLRFVNVQRSAYEQLPACEKADYVSLRVLTEEQRQEWLSALRLDKPGEGRNEFFEAAVNRASGITRNIEVLDYEIRRLLTRLGREHLRYVESQTGC